MKALLTIIYFTVATTLAFSQQTNNCASQLIENTFTALGGRNKIDSVKNIQFTGYGYRNLVEQSERFEGPYIPDNFTFNSILDRENSLLQFSMKDQLFNTDFKFLVDKEALAVNSRGRTGPWPQGQTIQDELELSPFQILKTALATNTVSCLPDTLIHGIANKRIRFKWKGHTVRVSINSNTNLFTLVEVQKPYNDYYMNVWGDVKKVVHYSFWDLLDNGLHYPMQKDIYFNGVLWESSLIRNTKLNIPVSSDSLKIPTDIKPKCLDFDNLMNIRISKMIDTKSEVAKDIWMIPGYCTSTILKQQDGLVIIEASHSSGYTDKVIQIAKEKFPDTPIKSFVTTSDAWLHCGGVRTAANTAKVIALSQNQEILEKLLKAPYTSYPDAWQQNKSKKAVMQYISKRTTLGTGPNRMELIPFNTEAGERMMMVYFPEHKLLYASDLYQPGNSQKHYTYEVIQAVEREKIEVESVFAMHSPVVKYADIVNLIRKR